MRITVCITVTYLAHVTKFVLHTRHATLEHTGCVRDTNIRSFSYSVTVSQIRDPSGLMNQFTSFRIYNVYIYICIYMYIYIYSM